MGFHFFALPVKPVPRLLNPLGVQAAEAGPAQFLRRDQAACLQHLQMLKEGRQRHVEGRRQITDRSLTFGKARHHRTPRRISECVEGRR